MCNCCRHWHQQSLSGANGNAEISHLSVTPKIVEEQNWGQNMTLSIDQNHEEFNSSHRKKHTQVGGLRELR